MKSQGKYDLTENMQHEIDAPSKFSWAGWVKMQVMKMNDVFGFVQLSCIHCQSGPVEHMQLC